MDGFRGPPVAPMAPTAYPFGPAAGMPRAMPIPMHQQPLRPQPQPQQQAKQPQDSAPKAAGSKSTPILHVEKKPRYVGCTFTAQDAGNNSKSWKNATQTIWNKPQSEIAQIAKKKFRSTPRGNVDVTPNVPLEDLPAGAKTRIESWLDEKVELEAEPDIYEWSIAAIRTKSKGAGLFSSGKNAIDVVLKRAVQKSVKDKIEAASEEADQDEPKLRRTNSTGDLGAKARERSRNATIADHFASQTRQVPPPPPPNGIYHGAHPIHIPPKGAHNFAHNQAGMAQQRPFMDPRNAHFGSTGMPPNMPNFFATGVGQSTNVKQPTHLPGKFPLPPDSVISSDDDSYIDEDDLFSDREPQTARGGMPPHPGAASHQQPAFGFGNQSAPLPQAPRFAPPQREAPMYHTAVPSNVQRGGAFTNGMPTTGFASKTQFHEAVPRMSGAMPQGVPIPPQHSVPTGGIHHQPDIRNMHDLFASQQPKYFQQTTMPGAQPRPQPVPATNTNGKSPEGRPREQSESPATDKEKDTKSKKRTPRVVYPVDYSSDESSDSFDDNDTIRTPLTGSSIGEEVPHRRGHQRQPSGGKHKNVDTNGYREHTRRPSQAARTDKERPHRRQPSSDTEESFVMVGKKAQRPRNSAGSAASGQQPVGTKYPIGRPSSRPSIGKDETAIVPSAPDALAKDPYKELQKEEMRRTQIGDRERELERLQQELHDLELQGRDRRINELRREKERRIDELNEMAFRHREDERRFEDEKEAAHQRRMAEMEDMMDKLGQAGRTAAIPNPGTRNSYREKSLRDSDPLLDDDEDFLRSRSKRSSRQRFPKVYEVSPEPLARRRTVYDDEFGGRERVYDNVTSRYRRADRERERARDTDLRDPGMGSYETSRMRNLRNFDRQTERMRARRGSFL